MSEMISGFIPLGYPKYSNNMNRNVWKNEVLIAVKIGVQNVTDFIVKAGLKTTKGISRSFVVATKNVKVLKVEIERLKKTRRETNEVRLGAEEITTTTEDV